MIMTKPYKVKNTRKGKYNIDKIFINRWSPRSISKKGFTKRKLMTLFEAARWAPSGSNVQPWRFLYSMNGDKNWKKFVGLLVDFNKMWAVKAGALIVVVSKKTDNEGRKSNTHSFDAGAAWENLALQSRMNGLVTHGMAGFDYKKARKVLKVPTDFVVQAMIAIGTQGNIEDIPERMQKQESPNKRNALKDMVIEGGFWK